MKPLTILVINWVKPGCEDEYQRLLSPVLDAMRFESTFINTVVHQDIDDPTRFMLYETWSDRNDFLTYNDTNLIALIMNELCPIY